MEAKMTHDSAYATSSSATSSPTLQNTAHANDSRSDVDTAHSSATSSPLSLPAKSPVMFERAAGDLSGTEPDTPSADSGRRLSSASTRVSRGGGIEKEKRKRSRVTPEQLVHLERFFAMDRSPTAARRKEISQLLGMQERQTQIWFQNRRAKAKVLDGKGKNKSDGSPPQTPELRQAFETDLQNLIHEDDAITIIPCFELTIGTWRRIATQIAKHDLITYVCENRRCLVWYIQSSGYGFKIEVPLDTIKETTYQNTSPGKGLASFFLMQPPLFFIEEPVSQDGIFTGQRTWKRSADWTEGAQASLELRHDLVGASAQLAHVLRHFNLPSVATPDTSVRSPPSFSVPSNNSPVLMGREPMPAAHYVDAEGFNPLVGVGRRAPFGSLRANDAMDYSLELDHPQSRASSQPSPAPSYSSYSQPSPSPGSSLSFPSPLSTNIPPYTTAAASMYPAPQGVLDDVAHVPLSRGYPAQNYQGLPGAPPPAQGHFPLATGNGTSGPNVPQFGMQTAGVGAPGQLLAANYGTGAPPGLVAQSSGLVGDPTLLSSTPFDDNPHVHRAY